MTHWSNLLLDYPTEINTIFFENIFGPTMFSKKKRIFFSKKLFSSYFFLKRAKKNVEIVFPLALGENSAQNFGPQIAKSADPT